MKIGLLISELSQKNGWAQYSLKLARALSQQGIDLRIISAKNANQHEAFSQLSVLPSVAPPDKHALLQMLRLYPQLRRELNDCDIIHSTVEIYAPLAVALAGKRPSFLTIHGSYVNLPRIRTFPINRLYQQAFLKSHLITVSHYTAKIAKQVIPESNPRAILNAVDFETYGMIKRNKSERPTILATGGVKARKGSLELVQAIATLKQTIPDILLVILGSKNTEPEYLVDVEAEIIAQKLENHVQLLGFVSHETLLDWYGKADVFAMPSINHSWKFEGFGLVHLEASAAGLPVIGTRNCGAEDAIIHGETGLLISQEHIAEALPNAILDLLSNPEKAQKMGEAGRKHAQTQTWENVGKQVINAYEEALSHRN